MTKGKSGNVVSLAGEKTVVVRVDRLVVHPRYGKRFRQSKKYMAHDAAGLVRLGDTVTIVPSRPRSKRKHWQIAPIIAPSAARKIT